MIERIRQLGDAQQSQSATDAELSPALEGVVMSEAKATELLQERTLRTVAGLQASAATIQVPDALQGVQEAVNNVRGFEQAEMDIAPFLWVPKPDKEQRKRELQESTNLRKWGRNQNLLPFLIQSRAVMRTCTDPVRLLQ